MKLGLRAGMAATAAAVSILPFLAAGAAAQMGGAQTISASAANEVGIGITDEGQDTTAGAPVAVSVTRKRFGNVEYVTVIPK